MSSSATMRLRVQECACYGGHLERFVRPLLLASLAQAPQGRHGYLLLPAIAEVHGFLPDPTGVYRALRGLEAEGMVVSEVEEGEGGPARRIYRITETGRACLATWATTLREYAETVQRVAHLCGSASSR